MIHDTLPDDALWIDIQSSQPALCRKFVAESLLVEEARIECGGGQVMGRADGVNVPGQMQVELLHRQYLRSPTTGGTALDAKDWPQAGLADTGDGGVA